MEKKTYWVAVQIPTSKYYLKAVNAPSKERAKEIVAGYCDYHNKRCNLSGDRIFRVVPTPTSYAIKILYNLDSVPAGLLLELFDKLGEVKSVHVLSSYYKYKVFDESTQALFLLDGIDTVYGDVTLKEMFTKVLESYKTEGVIIDYSIESYPYDGIKVKSFTTFNRVP